MTAAGPIAAVRNGRRVASATGGDNSSTTAGSWSLWYDASVVTSAEGGCQRARLRRVCTVRSVDALSLHFNDAAQSLHSSLFGGNIRLFRSDVLPILTDAANRQGGQWSLTMSDWDECLSVWSLVSALLLKPSAIAAAGIRQGPLSSVCGAVLSRTSCGEASLSLWLGRADGVAMSSDSVAAVGRAFAALAASAWVRVPSDWSYQPHATVLAPSSSSSSSSSSSTLLLSKSDDVSVRVTSSELKRRSRSQDGDHPAMEDLGIDQLLAVRYASQLLDASCAVKASDSSLPNVSVAVDVATIDDATLSSKASSKTFVSMLGARSRALYYAIPATALVSLIGYASLSAWSL